METQNEAKNQEDTTVQPQPSVPESAQNQDKKEKAVQQEPCSHAAHIQAALDVLYERFPKCFIREDNLKPLKIGIMEDLKPLAPELGMSVTRLRGAVRLYTNRLRYLYNTQEGVKRIDLEGNETEEVTAEHVAYAKEKINEINQKRKEAKEKKNQRQKKSFRQGAGGRPGFRKNQDGKKPYNNRFGASGANNKNFRRYGASASGENAGSDQRKPGGQNQVKYNISKFKKDFKVPRLTPTSSETLTAGTAVLVKTKSGDSKGVVASDAKGGVVTVTMENGMSITLPVGKVVKA